MTDIPNDAPNARKSGTGKISPTLDEDGVGNSPPEQSDPKSAAKAESKISKVVALLSREEGARLDELIAATGWQAHTTRAALTGLKKKGHVIERTHRDGVSCYRIKAAA